MRQPAAQVHLAGHQSPLHALSPAHCPPGPARNTPTLAEYSSDVRGSGSNSTAEAEEGRAAIDCSAHTAIAMAIGTASQHNSMFLWGGPKPCVLLQSAHQVRKSTHPFRRRGANQRRKPMGSPTQSKGRSVGLWEARAPARAIARLRPRCTAALGWGRGASMGVSPRMCGRGTGARSLSRWRSRTRPRTLSYQPQGVLCNKGDDSPVHDDVQRHG